MARPGIRSASRKPKQPRKPRAQRTVIPDAFGARVDTIERDLNRTVEAVRLLGDNFTGMEVKLLEVHKSANAALADSEASEKQIVASLRGIEEAVVKLVEHFLAAPAKERKPRAAKEDKLPDPMTDAELKGYIEAAKAKEKVEKSSCVHALAFLELVPNNPRLSRCTRCGAVIESPSEMMQKEVAKPALAKEEPKGEVVTFEVLRERAITYAQKHGKAKMLELMAPFAGVAAADVKLSLIPDAKRAAAVAALEA